MLRQDTRLMKSAGTISISVALRSIVVALFGVVLMFMTSPLLSALTLGAARRSPSRACCRHCSPPATGPTAYVLSVVEVVPRLPLTTLSSAG